MCKLGLLKNLKGRVGWPIGSSEYISQQLENFLNPLFYLEFMLMLHSVAYWLYKYVIFYDQKRKKIPAGLLILEKGGEWGELRLWLKLRFTFIVLVYLQHVCAWGVWIWGVCLCVWEREKKKADWSVRSWNIAFFFLLFLPCSYSFLSSWLYSGLIIAWFAMIIVLTTL